MYSNSGVLTPAVAHAGAEGSAHVDSDIAIIDRVKAGEVEAFDSLILKYRERLYGVIYNLTANREDASDLAQEAFIKAFRSIHKFKGKSAFFTWLYRIAVNGTISHLRKNRIRRFFSLEHVSDESSSSEIIAKIASRLRSDKPTMMKELQEKLNDAMQKLSLKHRTVVVLFEVEGLSHQEVATITKTSVGTVRSRLHYAKQQLQMSLREYLE